MALSGTAGLPDDGYDEHFLTLVAEEEARAVKRRRSSSTPSTIASPLISGGNAPAEVEDEGSYMAALRGSKSSTWQQQQFLTRQSVGRGRASGGPSSDGSRSGYADGGVRSDNACFKCGMPGHWAKDCTEMVVGGAQGRNQREPAGGGNQVPDKTCPCGVGVCAVFTSNTAKNPGRKFYRCPAKPEEGGCNFFEWCDNPPPSGISTTISSPVSKITSSQGGYSTKYQPPDERNRFSCFKCGQDGHWSKDCPLLSSQSNADASSGRSGSSTCYKCGQDGHWSKDCPLLSSKSNADAGSGRSGSSGTCFKCGKAGHWARDCTAQVSSVSAGHKRFSSSPYAGYK